MGPWPQVDVVTSFFDLHGYIHAPYHGWAGAIPSLPPNAKLFCLDFPLPSVVLLEQVRSQNDLISGMEGQMFDARGLLGGTLRRINTMMAQGGSRHMCYLVAFIVFTFMAIWYILKHSQSGR